MLSLISKYFKYPKDIVLFCTPRSGSHFYLTEYFSKFIVNNKLDYQVESGELFNPVILAWHNPKSHRIWSTDTKTFEELLIFKNKYGYEQLSNDISERIDQVSYYKKKYNLRLLYSVHPNHLVNCETDKLVPFLKKQHIFSLHRRNKIGQIYSWLRYRDILHDEFECEEAIKWMTSEIKQYYQYKKEFNLIQEIEYESLNLPKETKDYLLKHSPKRINSNRTEKITFYPKLQHENYKTSPYYFTILRSLRENKILKVKNDKQRILVMGLPGAGKTTFSDQLAEYLKFNSDKTVERINADQVRKIANDFDFSKEGRIRQSIRMFDLSWASEADYVICDFVAPTDDIRSNFSADWTILIDTIRSSRYQDTNELFEFPINYDMRVHNYDFESAIGLIGKNIIENKRRPKFDKKKSTLLFIGDFDGWDEDIQKFMDTQFSLGKQISIMVKENLDDDKKYKFSEIANKINQRLETKYQGKYEIISAPQINEIVEHKNIHTYNHIDNLARFKIKNGI